MIKLHQKIAHSKIAKLVDLKKGNVLTIGHNIPILQGIIYNLSSFALNSFVCIPVRK